MNQKQFRYFLIILILLYAILITLTGCSKVESKKPQNNVIVQSDDNKFQICIPENIEIEFNNDDNYTLDLFSENDGMYIYANTIYKNREVNLLDYVKDDKQYLLSTKENARDSSDISSIQIQDYTAYTYNFIYTDSEYEKDFYIQIVWIETSNNIYILNFEIITENKDTYIQIFDDIINSFIEQ